LQLWNGGWGQGDKQEREQGEGGQAVPGTGVGAAYGFVVAVGTGAAAPVLVGAVAGQFGHPRDTSALLTRAYTSGILQGMR
jgi:hypothetical protein